MTEQVEQLLYVSRSLPPLDQDDGGVASIIKVAEQRNPQLRVSGALIFTGAHFAQLLEGPSASLDELMVSIKRDDRHKDVLVVHRQDAPRRRFKGWSLAYAGPSLFVDRYLRRLLANQTAAQQKGNVDSLMGLFSSMRRLMS